MTLWTARALRVIEALSMRQAHDHDIEERANDGAEEKTRDEKEIHRDGRDEKSNGWRVANDEF